MLENLQTSAATGFHLHIHMSEGEEGRVSVTFTLTQCTDNEQETKNSQCDPNEITEDSLPFYYSD